MSKKIKYLKSIMKILRGGSRKMIGTFKMMVKSGEVFETDDIQIVDGFIRGVAERPRCI